MPGDSEAVALEVERVGDAGSAAAEEALTEQQMAERDALIKNLRETTPPTPVVEAIAVVKPKTSRSAIDALVALSDKTQEAHQVLRDEDKRAARAIIDPKL